MTNLEQAAACSKFVNSMPTAHWLAMEKRDGENDQQQSILYVYYVNQPNFCLFYGFCDLTPMLNKKQTNQ